MAAARFTISNDIPTWTGDYWRVTVRAGVVVAEDLRGYGNVPKTVAMLTMGSIVSDILAGDAQYNDELTGLVLAAGSYRAEHAL
ncbi:MAG: hypothetical protein WAV90_19290 [Gordonia amarae]